MQNVAFREPRAIVAEVAIKHRWGGADDPEVVKLRHELVTATMSKRIKEGLSDPRGITQEQRKQLAELVLTWVPTDNNGEK